MAVDTGRGCQIRDAATGAPRSSGEGRCPRGAAAFPGGERIALGRTATAGGRGDVIEIREIRRGTLHTGIRAGGVIRDIAVSGDGRLLMAAVSSDAGHRVRVWRTGDGSEVRSIDTRGSPRTILPLADPDLVGIRDLGGTMGIWRISTGERVHVFAHAVGAAGLAVATLADRAVTWLGGSLRLWNARSGAQLAHAESTSGVSEAAISPDGRTVAYLTEQTTGDARDEGLRALVLWEPGSKDASRVLPLERPGGLQFDPTGRRLVVRVGGDTVRVLEAPTLRALGTLRSGPGARIWDTGFSPDGALLFTREAKDRRAGLRVFALDRLQEVSRIDTAHWQRTAGPRAVATRSDDGRWWRRDLASVGADARLLDVDAQAFRHEPQSGRFMARIDPPTLDDVPAFLRDRVTIVPRAGGEFLNAWASDAAGRRLAVVSDAGISIHAADDGRELAAWPGVALAGAGLAVGPRHRPIRGLAFVGAGDALVAHDTSDYDRPGMKSRLWLWRWRGAEPALLSGEDPVNTVAASADGALLASAEGFERQDRATGRSERIGHARVRIWDAATGAMVRAIPLPQVVDAVAFSADGTRLAARTAKEVVVLGVRDGAEHSRFAFEGDELAAAGSVAFALGDRRVVAEAADGIQSWALDGGEHRLLRHESKWPRYSLSPDGKVLLTSTRGWLRIWDIESGAKRFELALEGRGPQSVALVGPGSELVATSERGVERIRWKSEDLIAEACRRLGRDFTPEEWRRFFDDEGQRVTCAAS
jgi:WD40 repeat protein